MPSGAWSNDQQNTLFLYDASTGKLYLRIDSTGLYYMNLANGSYFQVQVSPFTIDAGAVEIVLQPGTSSVPGVVYDRSAAIIGGELISLNTAGKVWPELVMISPAMVGKGHSVIEMVGQSNTSATDDSSIQFGAAFVFGNSGNEMSQGSYDEGGGYTSANFTSTEIAADYINVSEGGLMVSSRRYEGRWHGTAQSTVAGDRIGLRIYSGPNTTSLTGATLLCDYGQVTVPAANVGAPFGVNWGYNGLVAPNTNLILGARRASGTGTCSVTINYRRAEDSIEAY